jgi:hypothetical protein
VYGMATRLKRVTSLRGSWPRGWTFFNGSPKPSMMESGPSSFQGGGQSQQTESGDVESEGRTETALHSWQSKPTGELVGGRGPRLPVEPSFERVEGWFYILFKLDIALQVETLAQRDELSSDSFAKRAYRYRQDL